MSATLAHSATLAAFRAARASLPAEGSTAAPGTLLSLPSVSLERAVLDLIADGTPNSRIALLLEIPEPEVRAAIGRLMTALDAWSKPGLVAAGFAADWLARVPSPRPDGVSVRDEMLLRSVASAWPDSRTADVLGLWVSLVEGAVERLRRVLQARDRAHLVRRAVDAGVLPVGVWMPHARPGPARARAASESEKETWEVPNA